MSFIDLIAALIIISLCYIGYTNGIKGKTFFLISFAISSFLMYLIYNAFFISFIKVIPNLLLANILSIGFIFIPLFSVIEFVLRKTINTNYKGKTVKSRKLTMVSRAFGALVGFIGGYIFVFVSIFIIKTDIKTSPLLHLPPSLQKSFFYKLVSYDKKKEEVVIKIDNIKMLQFLYSNDVISKFEISKDELIVILKMIKGISNKSALELKEQEFEEDIPQIFLLLKAAYEKDLGSVDLKYQSDPREIEAIFSKFKSSKKLKKRSKIEEENATLISIISDYSKSR